MKFRFVCKLLCALLLAALVVLPFQAPALATSAETPSPTPAADEAENDLIFPLNLLLGSDDEIEQATTTTQIMILLTVLALTPSILIMFTAFTRIIIVLSFTRQAMGTQQMPPNQVMIGLALFLTYFVMQPVFAEINEQAWQPFESGEIVEVEEAYTLALKPVRDFMYEQIRIQGHESDLRTFINLAQLEELPETPDDIPTRVLVPAYITSEIKTAFTIGFYIYIPFIVIDMVVASALMSMGMMMLPPVMISLPFKIMLFVLVDGWNLTIGSLIQSFSP